MEEINRLFEEVNGLDSLSKIYKSGKKDIEQLEDEINELKRLRNTIDTHSLDDEISKYEHMLEEIIKEIECISIMKNTCVSISELEKALSVIDDSEKCLEKCIGFMNSLFTVFTLTSESVECIFNIEREEYNLFVMKINKDVEKLLSLAKKKDFFNDLQHNLKHILSTTIKGCVPYDTDIFLSDDSLYLIFPSDESSTDECFKISNLCKSSFGSISSEFPMLSESILLILKSNLSKSLFRDEYSLVDIIENNKKMENTPSHIEDVNEWALDMAIKETNSVCKNGDRSKDLCSIDSGVSGKYISTECSKLFKILKFIRKSTSQRKEKATVFYNRAVMKFFSIERCDTLVDYFMMYSDITYFIKKTDDSKLSDEMNKIREDIFYKIMKTSTIIDVDLNEPILRLKANIKQKQFDFDENVDSFISPQTQKFFKIQFFEKIYAGFIGIILKPRKYSVKDKETLKELAQYLMDISFELDPESILNYEKIASFSSILGSSLEEVIEMYECGQINLDKNELRSFVRFGFEDSDIREGFINMLM